MNSMVEINDKKVKVDNIKSTKNKRVFLNIIVYLLLVALCIIVAIPFYILVVSSFKDGSALMRYGINLKLNFSEMSLENFILLFSGTTDYFVWFFNSLKLAVITVALTLFCCAAVGYGFEMYDFKGKNFLFICVLFVMMVPFEILMVPMYKQIIDMGLIDTYAAIYLPGIAGAGTVFFFRQYLKGIPKELIDAARIDGATEYGIFFKIALPIMKPAFAAMGILCAMGSWNNLLWPMLVVQSPSKVTLPVGLNTLVTPYGNNYDVLFAGACFSVIPILIVFVCFQKYFVDGMTAGAIKG